MPTNKQIVVPPVADAALRQKIEAIYNAIKAIVESNDTTLESLNIRVNAGIAQIRAVLVVAGSKHTIMYNDFWSL